MSAMPKTNYKDQIDPELWESIRNFPYNMALVSMGNVYQEAAYRKTEIPEGIVQKTIEISGTQGLTFPVDVFEPAGREEPAPALIYAHGGAFSYKPDVYHKKLACIYAAKAGGKVLFAHYHLLPKFPYPAAYEDVLALYRYALEHADELGIGSSRIGLGGDSAGASLAALISHRYEQEGLARPCLQMLVYPMTDAEMQTDSMKEFTDTPMWNARFTEKMWTYYCDDPGEKYSASPMHCELPGSIPDTYIETAQFDCLHDEGILYAQKLKESGAYVELYDTKGTYHGYDVAIDAQIVQDQIAKRVAFLKRGFCYEV